MGGTALAPIAEAARRPGDAPQESLARQKLGRNRFARNIQPAVSFGWWAGRVEERDAPSVPEPLTAARHR
jgi:hypothetical protein